MGELKQRASPAGSALTFPSQMEGPPSRDPLFPSSAAIPAAGHLSHPQDPLPAGISLQSQEWGMEEARGPPLALGGPATQTLSSGWASPDDDHPPFLRPRAPDAVFTRAAKETAWLAFEWCGKKMDAPPTLLCWG